MFQCFPLNFGVEILVDFQHVVDFINLEQIDARDDKCRIADPKCIQDGGIGELSPGRNGLVVVLPNLDGSTLAVCRYGQKQLFLLVPLQRVDQPGGGRDDLIILPSVCDFKKFVYHHGLARLVHNLLAGRHGNFGARYPAQSSDRVLVHGQLEMDSRGGVFGGVFGSAFGDGVDVEERAAGSEQHGSLGRPPRGVLDNALGAMEGREKGSVGGEIGNGFGLHVGALANAEGGEGEVSDGEGLGFGGYGFGFCADADDAGGYVVGAVGVQVHGVAVEVVLLGARVGRQAIGLALLLPRGLLLGRGLLHGAVCLVGKLVGGDALVQGEQGAVASRVGAAMVAAKVVALGELDGSAWLQRARGVYSTYVGGLGLQLVEPQAILQQIDQGVRLDVARKGQCLGVSDPAPREMQGGIAVAGFLEIAPDEVVDHIGRQRFDGHGARMSAQSAQGSGEARGGVATAGAALWRRLRLWTIGAAARMASLKQSSTR